MLDMILNKECGKRAYGNIDIKRVSHIKARENTLKSTTQNDGLMETVEIYA